MPLTAPPGALPVRITWQRKPDVIVQSPVIGRDGGRIHLLCMYI
jgi:hypothetical protein